MPVTDWTTIADVNARFAELGLPEGWTSESDPELSARYFESYRSVREQIFREHLAMISEQERVLIEAGEHSAQSHERGEAARLIADELEAALGERGINFVEKVEIGAYHGDRLIFSILVNSDIDQAEAEAKLPFYFHGFETRWRQKTN